VELEEVRRLLDRDRVWSLYALGDLDAARAEYCRWYTHGETIVLRYVEFDPPILMCAGPNLESVFAGGALDSLRSCFLHLRAEHLAAVESRFRVTWKRPMWRMRLGALQASGLPPAEPLDAEDLEAVQALYADGRDSHESPDFFFASMLPGGAFHGVRVDGELVAAGGTHLICEAESVAAIGNIYTKRGHRGRGYGARVTESIARELGRRGIRTIGLNVKHENATALALYQRLGFEIHCEYWEGQAER